MHLTRPTLLKIGGYIALSLLIAGVIIFMDAWNTVQTDRQREAQTDVTYRDTVDGVDWYTYTNRIYGYAISYPEGIDLTRSSEVELINLTDDLEKDARILLTDKAGDKIYTVTAGASPDRIAKSHLELRENFKIELLPDIIRRYNGDLTDENLIITDTLYQGRPAILIKSPVSYRLVTSNNNGMSMTVSGSRYTGATTTPKEQLTREIMETFRVLD